MRERKRRLWVRREQGESGRKLDRAQTFPKIRQSELRDNVALELWNCNDNIFKKNVHIFVITQSKLRKNPENVGDGVNSSKPKCNKISVWKWGDYKSKCSMLMVVSKMVDTDRYRRRKTTSWRRRKWTSRITRGGGGCWVQIPWRGWEVASGEKRRQWHFLTCLTVNYQFHNSPGNFKKLLRGWGECRNYTELGCNRSHGIYF